MFFFCLVFAMPLCASVYMCLVVTCWERTDLLALVYGVYRRVCHFPIGILGQVWYLIVSIPDLCTLTYYVQLLNIYVRDQAFFYYYRLDLLLWVISVTLLASL